jgi:two-component system, chemotaxis family, chemotaxis protein CheY
VGREARDDDGHSHPRHRAQRKQRVAAAVVVEGTRDTPRRRSKDAGARRRRRPGNDDTTGPTVADGTASPIMLIEDDDDLRDGIAYLLEACGYEVIAASDGEDGLEHLRRGVRPCLILLDLLMPRKDGFQFRMEQIQSADFAAIPTIAYSGIYTGSGLREKAQALGITTVIEKPVDYDALLDLVEQYCARR